MNTLRFLSFIAFLCVANAAIADENVDASEVPETVAAAVESYFPGSTILEAERDKKDGKWEYELYIRYRDLELEVDVSSDGDILDVEMEN